MNEISLPESSRTVVLSEEDAKIIEETIDWIDERSVTEAMGNVTNILLNNVRELPSDIGNIYFTLRRLQEFHAKLIARLKPVGEAYKEATLS
jgi:hypothetical protein